MFRCDGNQAGADASILIANGAEHVFKGEKASCLLFVIQLNQLRVEVGFHRSRFVERQVGAILFYESLGDVSYVLVVIAVTVTGWSAVTSIRSRSVTSITDDFFFRAG